MTRGTLSLLVGAHQFILHPICVALAWKKLYGSFPLDPRKWLAFLTHDWGYWGCPDMDGKLGKLHPWRAAIWFTVLDAREPARWGVGFGHVSSPEAWFDSVKAYLDEVALVIVAGGDPGVPPSRSDLEEN